MKKMKYVGLLLSLFAMLVSIAAAPLAGTAIALVEVRNDPDGDVIFVFSVDGKFSRSELKGFVQVQGGDANYTMYCNQVDTDRVNCTVSRKAGGKNVIVTFGGATFWAYVPEPRPLAPSCQFEYNAYDWNELNFFASTAWESIQTFCTDTPAQDGDMLTSTLWDGNLWDYEYFSTGVDNAYCGWANAGPGYYYQDDYSCAN